jgi:pimeloyl-ACP methyl ester carboxylesterase
MEVGPMSALASMIDTHATLGQGRRLSPRLFEGAARLDTRGGTVRYRRVPCDRGPKLLFAVDGPNVLEQYEATFAAFNGRADVTVFEPPGTGASAPAPGFPFTFSALADVAREVIVTLRLAPVTLVFPCYLGFVAALLSREHRAVLVQTPSWADMRAWAERVDRRRMLRRPVVGQVLVRTRRQALARLWYRSSAGDAERAQRLTVPAVDVLRAGGCFCLASLFQGIEREPFAANDCAPHMLLWGPRDRTHRKVDPAEAWPGAAVRRLETCGHSPELEEPEVFAQTLLDGLP